MKKTRSGEVNSRHGLARNSGISFLFRCAGHVAVFDTETATEISPQDHYDRNNPL